ncbi:MAG: cysteine peptidase family C39 domain-containing protein [Thermodesulfovibrio sp.]|nr:cysteine peptidase family C39 domain-containing protein [Thermodesulfovibrio sp.]MDW7997888.1 cysteine peptidase family C39 domain-containing protein [Thermodesulfovibrio sp.]
MIYLKLIVFMVILFTANTYAEVNIINHVPFFPSEDFQCGPTSLAMVLNFWGMKVTVDEIAKEIYSKGAKGTADFDLIIYAQKKGFKTLNYKGNMEDLKEKIRANKPLIVMTDEGYWFYKKYHFIVVVGFDSDSVIVNSEKIMHKRIKIEDFEKKWSKTGFWTLLIEK